jgi:cytochrome bd-type quinol oxidase subunit 2
MKSRRTNTRFRRSLLNLFFIYLVLIPTVFFLMDRDLIIELYQDDPLLFIAEMIGAALALSFILSYIAKKDRQLRG